MTISRAPALRGMQLDTHAGMDGGPLCGPPGSQQVTGDWAAVTCADCQLAAPAPAPAGLDGADLAVLAEAQVMVILAAAPRPLRLHDIMLRADPAYRAAILPALDRLAAQGALEETGQPGGPPRRWRLVPCPAGHG